MHDQVIERNSKQSVQLNEDTNSILLNFEFSLMISLVPWLTVACLALCRLSLLRDVEF